VIDEHPDAIHFENVGAVREHDGRRRWGAVPIRTVQAEGKQEKEESRHWLHRRHPLGAPEGWTRGGEGDVKVRFSMEPVKRANPDVPVLANYPFR